MSSEKKRCLYEILGVSRECSQEEIRSAYRRLALQLHPDKLAQSGVSSADATAAFQELLHAYEVLSDPRERSYYDSHRSQILFSDPKSHHRSPFFHVDLYSFFSNSAFSGYSDSGKGFYRVYGDVFAKIYAQELWFAKEMGVGPGPDAAISPAPLIGNLDSPYSQVTAFYGYWLGFCSVMDFGWVDEYDASIGPNRRSRRLMEEENKKARKKARREYNDSVRGLAAFAKKRDKRVVDMLAKKKLEEERRRDEEKAKKKEEERKRMEKVMLYEEPEWARIDEDAEEVLNEKFDELEGEKKKKGGEELYCVVCSKKFKSDKQWKNHEQSKKHKDKVAELRDLFQEEEEVGPQDDDIDETGVGGFDYVPDAEDSDVVDEFCVKIKDDLRFRENGDEVVASEVSDSGEESSVLEAMMSGDSGHRIRTVTSVQADSPHSKAHPTDGEEESFMEYDNRKKSRRNSAMKKGNNMKPTAEDMRTETSEPFQDGSRVEDQENGDEAMKQSSSHNFEEAGAKSEKDRVSAKTRKPKKQQVDEKSAGKKEGDVVTKSSSKGKKKKGTSKSSGNECGTCGESFDSRNKMFAHLGDTGHAMLKSR